MKDFDNYFLQQEEPIKSCLLALKHIIFSQDKAISTAWKYGMPFFCFHNKMFCYLWIDKKLNLPYIGFVEGKHLNHPLLMQEKRSRMKILKVDPNTDLNVDFISKLIKEALDLYRNGVVKIKVNN